MSKFKLVHFQKGFAFTKLLFFQAKKDRVHSLRELNSEAEKTKSFGEFITEDFQRRYNIIDQEDGAKIMM